MIVTKRFVFIHMPKTGGTFVRTVLERLGHLLGTQSVSPPRWRTLFIHPDNHKHATCRDVPEAHRNKLILSSVRNPYDLWVSEYEFGWWKRREYNRHFRRLVPNFRKRFPEYPDLEFEEFVRLYNSAFCLHPRNRRWDSKRAAGWVTERFLRYYSRRPYRVILWRDSWPGQDLRCSIDLHDIHFLQTHQLNRDLYSFLQTQGHPARELEFILRLGKILPGGKGRSEEQKWERYYTPELKNRIRRRERLLFRLFPQFDV